LTGGPEITLVSDENVHVASQSGNLFEIQARFRDGGDVNGIQGEMMSPIEYYPAVRLPKGSVFVVRTTSLVEFEERTRENAGTQNDATMQEKPLSTKERNTLLTIIAALCDYSNIDFKARGASAQITAMTQEIGAEVSDDTIRKVLTKIPDAIETRMK
jgi:hypothetical protein